MIERDSAGRALRSVGLCLDVDERHKSARALEHSESRFAHAVWGTSVGFWDHDLATDTVHWWNDWCASVDLDPCDGPDHSARWDLRVHPDDLLNFDRRYQALLEGRSGCSYESEYRMRTRSGNWRWIMSRGRATARDARGRAVRMAGVAIDIDARKRVELALRDSEARLEAAIWGADLGLWEWNLEDDFLTLLYGSRTGRRDLESTRRVRTVRSRRMDRSRFHPMDRQKYAAEDHAPT